MAFPLSELTSTLRVAPGPIDLGAIETDAAPGFDGEKKDGEAALAELGPGLAELQERLFADGKSGGRRNLLLVLQGMDTSGKGGTLRSTVGLVDPQGVRITSFKAPTPDERAHDFLWRITRALPPVGLIGVFDRSHYEDVLIARVRSLAPPEEIERRYAAINAWEAELAAEGTTIIKCMLHISAEEQKNRLLARLDDDTKHWKYNPGDVDERELWPAYQEAYEIAIARTNTEVAPWHVIPADKKWYRNLAIGTLLHDALQAFDLGWPSADFDVEHEKRRLLDEKPL
ncbi:PPK2 family polyphosphate kinase [Nocardioides daeguensis]|uniref:Polyphosphate kinase 2 family protein n=1 Tax=Nocardioides daeguensis TaxID=908359 RepID=A0ABP6VWR7_9ACTN|nr:PPK2 family polyphosphate kinase [Nocardioides daeguensis]MBV6726899.1 polyphosphate kinase 2 family protein [Nocardioides daeguensis]MCR1772898.1 polyphosphate kinase 2 family protein [Nocardioides daeguensis]